MKLYRSVRVDPFGASLSRVCLALIWHHLGRRRVPWPSEEFRPRIQLAQKGGSCVLQAFPTILACCGVHAR